MGTVNYGHAMFTKRPKKEGRPLAILWTIALVIAVIIIIAVFAGLDIWLGFQKFKRRKQPPTPPVRKSDVQLFGDGRRFFNALKEDMEKATHHIHLSFYIFRADQIGEEIIRDLINKVKDGVKVRLLLDAVGCAILSRKARKQLHEGGVELAFSAKPFFPYFFYSLNRRNHRKIAVIDGLTGYFGGFNVGDEYLGRKADKGDWRDYHLRLTGEGVKDLQKQFLRDWHDATSKKIDDPDYYPDLTPGAHSLKLFATNADHLETSFIDHLSKAKKRVFIGTPYFVPSRRLEQTLHRLLDEGVALTLLLPMKKDHPFVKPVSYVYFKPLLEKGARVFHYYHGFYHAKVFIVDDDVCYIGTANFDMRSLIWNDEMNGYIYDQALIKEIEAITAKDLKHAIEITLKDINRRPIGEKSKSALSQPLAPLL